jgi:hypothetical protein
MPHTNMLIRKFERTIIEISNPLMSIKPEDILPDSINEVEINGIKARKGTVAAALANAKILASNDSTEIEKNDANEAIKELAPAMVALGLHHHLTWKNLEIQNIIEECVKHNNKL